MAGRALGRAVIAVVTGGLALLVAGCSCAGSAPGEGLEGVDWALQGSSASSVDFRAIGVTARFEDGAVKGSSGVNTYTAKYEVGADRSLAVSDLVATLMAGTPEAMQAEQTYLTLLRAVRSFAVSEGTLTLSDSDGNQLLVYQKAETRAAARTGPDGADYAAEASETPGVLGVSDTSVAYARSIGGTSHRGELLYFIVGASHSTEASASADLNETLPFFGDMQSYYIVQRSDNFAGMTPGLWVVVEAYRKAPGDSDLQFARRAFEDAYIKRATVRTDDPIPVYEDLVD